MKILVADDNPRIRNLIKKLLDTEIQGYELYECSDGEQAVCINDAEHPDLILMDIMMKKMDGITATKQIHQKYPEAIIIIISQLPESEFKLESLKAGAKAYLQKERLVELTKKISDLIKTK
jgi:CheY-like chemotaxis protein